MNTSRYIAAAVGALAFAGALAGGAAQAAMPGATDAIANAAEVGAVVEPVLFRYGGYDYCWYDNGWRGPGWYWCGYAYRVGFGWGGPFGWNHWFYRDRDDFRFRDHDDHFRFREGRFHDHDERFR